MSAEQLVRASTIARMLGVSRQRVNALAKRPEFPPPKVAEGGRLWDRGEIEKWNAERPGK
jgi:predicted DNA-binding transcriptional regulator AlpA